MKFKFQFCGIHNKSIAGLKEVITPSCPYLLPVFAQEVKVQLVLDGGQEVLLVRWATHHTILVLPPMLDDAPAEER